MRVVPRGCAARRVAVPRCKKRSRKRPCPLWPAWRQRARQRLCRNPKALSPTVLLLAQPSRVLTRRPHLRVCRHTDHAKTQVRPPPAKKFAHRLLGESRAASRPPAAGGPLKPGNGCPRPLAPPGEAHYDHSLADTTCSRVSPGLQLSSNTRGTPCRSTATLSEPVSTTKCRYCESGAARK